MVDEYIKYLPKFNYAYNEDKSTVFEQEDSEIGDINLDGVLNILDVVLLTNFIMGEFSPSQFSEVQLLNMDFNGDNTIDILDAVQLVGEILG